MKIVLLTECGNRCRKRRFAAAPDLDEGLVVMTIFEQSRRALPKNLIRPLLMQDREDGGSGDLLSRSPVHADARDEEDYGGGVAAKIGKTLTQIRLILVKGNRLFI